MAFSNTVDEQVGYAGPFRIVTGTFTGTAVTTGELVTGLTNIKHIGLTANAAAVGNAPVVNETFPLDTGTATIIFDSGEVGTWFAIGI